MSDLDHFVGLGVALLLGMLIGLERGWKKREAEEGSRVAGIRTYALIGLFGGAWALVGELFGPLVLGFGVLAITIILATAYWVSTGREHDLGVTGIVAALLAFVFGALAASGLIAPAAAGAVVTVLVLGYKPQLHGWLSQLEHDELFAAFKLLVITVVVLPILPDQGYGPYQALNPFRIWWMVIVIAGISFVGYIAVRYAGPRRGLAFTGLVGGLASSTAVTLNFARICRTSRHPAMPDALAGGALFSCATMFPRIWIIVLIVDPSLAMEIWPPLLVTTVLAYAIAALLWRRTRAFEISRESSPALYNPLALNAALLFGLMLAAILLLSRLLQHGFGEFGLYTLAATAGLADVAAISLTVGELHQFGDIASRVAIIALVTAAVVNTLVKIALAGFIGGWHMGLRLGVPLIIAIGAGLAMYWLLA